MSIFSEYFTTNIKNTINLKYTEIEIFWKYFFYYQVLYISLIFNVGFYKIILILAHSTLKIAVICKKINKNDNKKENKIKYAPVS